MNKHEAIKQLITDLIRIDIEDKSAYEIKKEVEKLIQNFIADKTDAFEQFAGETLLDEQVGDDNEGDNMEIDEQVWWFEKIKEQNE